MSDIPPVSGSAATGIEGLDNVLAGGFARNRVYLIEGNPGTGKTTAAIQFLVEGVRADERALYITLSETIAKMHETAPWNEEPDFEYIADPTPKGGMPPAPINPDDERPASAKAQAKAR